MITKIKKHIDQSLNDFFERVKAEYKLHLVDPTLYESLKEFTLREGKRIRPLLLILSYKGYEKKDNGFPRTLYNASTCMELLHCFMLIHDDIIDRSDLRRGRPTLHRLLRKIVKTPEQDKLGYDLGIIAGDILYALAIDAFLAIKEAPARKERALKYFIQTATFTAMGEFIDTLHGVDKITKVQEKDVFLNYTLKTARYTFDCPMVVGAILAGAKERDIKQLSELGVHIGQAFQIQDDILGIFGSQKNIGKSILSDLSESKKTLLVCHAYSKLSVTERRRFMKYFSKPKKTYQDLVAVRRIFINSGSLDYSLQEIKKRLDQSQEILNKLHLKKSYRQLIHKSLLSPFHVCVQIAAENNIHEFKLTE
jgi:geranylgeranyl diphosphate synthase type I